jgi:HAMP domain-containing protein
MMPWRPLKILLTWAVSSCLVVGVPLLLFSYGIGKYWAFEEVEYAEKGREQMERTIFAIHDTYATHGYISPILQEEFRTIIQVSDCIGHLNQVRKVFLERMPWIFAFLPEFSLFPEDAAANRKMGELFLSVSRDREIQSKMKSLMKRFRKRFPGNHSFWITDSRGKILSRVSDPGADADFLKRFFLLLRAVDSRFSFNAKDERLKIVERRWRNIQPFLGPQANPVDLVGDNRGLFLTSSVVPPRFFFGYVSSGLGFFGRIEVGKDWNLIPLRDQLKSRWQGRKSPGMRVGLIEDPSPKPHDSSEERFVKSLSLAGVSSLDSGARLYVLRPMVDGSFLWASLPSRKEEFRKKRLGLAFLVGAMFFLLARYFREISFRGRPVPFSIRTRLGILFLYAAGFPLLTLGIFGWVYLRQHALERIADTHSSVERVIHLLDQEYSLFRHHLQKRVEEVLHRFSFEDPKEKPLLLKALQEISEDVSFGHFLIADSKGHVVWNNSVRTGQNTMMQKLVGAITSTSLAMVNQGQGSFMGGIIFDFFQTLQAEKDLMADVTRSLGRFFPANIGKKDSWISQHMLKSPDGVYRKALTVLVSFEHMEGAFFEANTPSLARRFPGIFILGTNADYRRQSQLGALHFDPHVFHLYNQMFLQQETIRRQVEIGKKTFLVSVVKPRNLTGKYLIGLVDDAMIRKEIRRGEYLLAGFTVFCLLTGLAFGLMLAHHFIVPIRNLADGVESLNTRDFQHRLPSGENDELGDLVQTYNAVLEGLADLDVARIVQENLFSKGALEFGEYRAFGACVPATQVGGDIYSLRFLPDGRLLILIGDVAGHGIPAALIMAMARAVLEGKIVLDQTSGNLSSPDGFLKHLQETMFKTLAVKKMMTCFVGILDPQKHHLEFSNAGHNFPFRWLGKTGEFLPNQPSLPLSKFRAVKNFSPSMEPIPSGQGFLFYTDGLVEAKAADGSEIGYDSIMEMVVRLATEDPEETYRAVMNWHRSITGSGPQEDDITLILLYRR